MEQVEKKNLIIASEDKKYKRARFISKFICYAVLTILAIMFIFPFVFAVATAFTSPSRLYDIPFSWMPDPISFANVIELFTRINILQGFLNTMMYITPPLVVGLFCSSMGAYAFARMNFPGKRIIFSLMMSTMMIPGVITLIPSYIMWANLYNLAGTAWPLIIPGMFGGVVGMFFLKQYFATLPKELEEAAQIDGMTRWGILIKIFYPLSKAALITQLVLGFNGMYNEYLGPLLYIGATPSLHTLQLMLAGLQTQFSKPYTLMMAGALVALLPTFVLFLFVQRYFIEGIVMSGLKG